MHNEILPGDVIYEKYYEKSPFYHNKHCLIVQISIEPCFNIWVILPLYNRLAGKVWVHYSLSLFSAKPTFVDISSMVQRTAHIPHSLIQPGQLQSSQPQISLLVCHNNNTTTNFTKELVQTADKVLLLQSKIVCSQAPYGPIHKKFYFVELFLSTAGQR